MLKMTQIDEIDLGPIPIDGWTRLKIHINDIKQSIEKIGINQPVTLYKKDESYKIVDGFCRIRAAKELGLEEIPAVIINEASAEEIKHLISRRSQ